MRIALALALASAACGPDLLVWPQGGSSFGHFQVRATGDLESLGEPLTVTVGGIGVYGLTRDAKDAVRFTVQGTPSPGPAQVVVRGPKGELASRAFTYTPSVDPRFNHLVAFGASLTMGVQSVGFAPRSQLRGTAAQIARAAGAFA